MLIRVRALWYLVLFLSLLYIYASSAQFCTLLITSWQGFEYYGNIAYMFDWWRKKGRGNVQKRKKNVNWSAIQLYASQLSNTIQVQRYETKIKNRKKKKRRGFTSPYNFALPSPLATLHLINPLGFVWGTYTSASFPVFFNPLCQLKSNSKKCLLGSE